MRIFLTGATGAIGGAVLDALVRGGHQVTALVRDTQKAARITERGAHPVVGSLTDPESYRAAADAQDGYIHTAFDTQGDGIAVEKQALESLLAAARRPRTSGNPQSGPRFLISTSSLWVIGRASEPADETTPIHPIPIAEWRVEHERLVLDAGSDQLRTAVVRPGIVYGRAGGVMADLLKMASNGLVRVVGDGNNHWPLVYDRDLADLYLKIATRDDASGVFHGNDEGDETVNDIVTAISPYLAHRPDVRFVPIEEARTKMGLFADASALDQIIRSTRSRAIGWTPSLKSVAGNAARLLGEWRSSRD
jgi:nucleoside-diphosphate-sugar epimerase